MLLVACCGVFSIRLYDHELFSCGAKTPLVTEVSCRESLSSYQVVTLADSEEPMKNHSIALQNLNLDT